jgi:hypothetical protein
MFAAAGLAVGCASTEPAVPGAPDWFGAPTKGCGTAVAKLHGDLGLAQTAAIDRARAQLAKNLNVEVQALLKDYQDSGESDGKDFNEEKTTNVIRTLVDRDLAGSFPVQGKLIDNQYYSMVCMDPEFYGKMFDEMKSLSQKDRAALKARADAAHDELRTAVAEKRAKEAQ